MSTTRRSRIERWAASSAWVATMKLSVWSTAPGCARKLGHHRFQHRLLAKIGLQQRGIARAASVIQRELAKAGDARRSAAAEDIDGLADKALLASADVMHRAQAAIGEAQLDRSSFPRRGLDRRWRSA